MEAFRDSEEQQAATVGQLHHKMNASLIDMASLSDAGSTDGKQDKTMGHATVRSECNYHVAGLCKFVPVVANLVTKKWKLKAAASAFKQSIIAVLFTLK